MRQIKPATLLSGFGSSKKLLVLMLVVIVTITVDSQIGYIADFIPEQLSSSGGIALFIIIPAIFVITQYLILAYVMQLNKEIKDRASHLLLLQAGVTIGQYLLAAVIALVILQILFSQEYSILNLYITYAISYGLWIVTLALLARAFFSWYRFSNKDVMVLILTLSMIAHVVNGISGLVTYFYVLGQQKPVITTTDVAYFPTFSIALMGSQVEIINDIASSTAYVLTWIGTIKLLYPYIKKLGEIKFWIIMSAALCSTISFHFRSLHWDILIHQEIQMQ